MSTELRLIGSALKMLPLPAPDERFESVLARAADGCATCGMTAPAPLTSTTGAEYDHKPDPAMAQAGDARSYHTDAQVRAAGVPVWKPMRG